MPRTCCTTWVPSSMIGSDSQGVGRAAESAQRAFQLAAVNKVRFGRFPG